jgi:hypothetical protein
MARLKHKVYDATGATDELFDPSNEPAALTALPPLLALEAQLHLAATTVMSQALEHPAHQALPHLPTEMLNRAITLLDSESLFTEHAFENALPIPEVIDATNGRNITLQVRQINQFLGLYGSDGDPSTRQFGVTEPE